MKTTNPTDPTPVPDDISSRRSVRWLPTRRVGVALLLCAVLVVYLQVGDATGDPGINNVLSMLLGALAIAILVLWFLLFSGRPRWIRLLPLAGVAAFVLLFGTFYRLEQVTGALIPKFAPRSAPVAVAPSAAAPVTRPGTVDLVTTTAADFPQFLGRNRDLKVAGVRLDRAAAMPPELLWRQPIGAGWSGFAVVNGYAVTMEQRGGEERVSCYRAASGELLWSHAIVASFVNFGFGDGPRATPVIDEGRVYALGATGRLRALDGGTGELLWDKDLPAEYGMTPAEEAKSLPYGRSNSPLVVGDLLVVPAGGPAGRRVSLVAYDKRTGERVWEGGDRQISCSSPAVARLAGSEQILSVNEDTVSGHDVSTGDVLWEHPWPGSTDNRAHASQPVPVAPNRIFLSKGYSQGAALLELTPRADGRFDVTELWHEARVLR
ncbi:MAG: PQQ-binding-like beta-propeller repeat protein, partial [Thermoanaerobaculia bacterium]